MIIKLHSAEYEDHRLVYINTDLIKMFYQHEPDVTHIILGDGYPTDGFPVECVPVQETAEQVWLTINGPLGGHNA